MLNSNQNQAARAVLEKLVLDSPDDKNILYYLALSCHRSGETEKAEKILTKIVNEDVNSAAAHVTLASIYRGKKDYEKAIKHSKLATNLDQQSTVYLNDLGVSYSVAGMTELAMKAYDKVLQIDPSNITTLFNTGKLYLREKQFQRAEESLSKALNLQKNNCQIILLLAEAMFSLGKVSQAQKLYNTIIALNPPELKADLGRINYMLGRCYLTERNYKSSVSCFNRSLEHKYARDRTNFYLGQAAFEQEEYDKAFNLLKKIPTDKWRDIPEVSYYMGLCLFEQKQYTEALENLQEALMSGLPKAPVLTRMGLSYLHLEDNLAGQKKQNTTTVLLAKAKDLFERALKNDPDNIKAMMGIGRVLYKEKKTKEALEIMRSITKISGGYSRADLLSSLCYYDLSDRANAILLAEKYLRQQPMDSKVVMYLAQLQMESGENKKAIILLRDVIKLDSTNWDAMILLSSACSEEGRYIEAAEILLNVLNDSEDDLILKRAQKLYNYITKPFKELLFPERNPVIDIFPPGSMGYILKKLSPAIVLKEALEKEKDGATADKLLKLIRELIVDFKDLRNKKLFEDEGSQNYYKKEIRKLTIFIKELK
jgi:tetratricopeptide (TPR) repeat protein